MPPFALPLALLLAYLIGSIPFAVAVSRMMGLADPRSFGSGNPGATNMMRTGSRKAAVLTLLGDAGKGALVVVLGRLASLDADALALCGAAAFTGHVFSVFLGFRGGKGVATAGGVLLALEPALGAMVCAVWVAAFMALRVSALGALAAGIAAPLLAWGMLGPGTPMAVVTVMSAVMLARHRSNFRQWLEQRHGRTGG